LQVHSQVLVSGMRDIHGHWAEAWIADLVDRGLMVGENGYFHPRRSITRAEAATVIAKLLPEAAQLQSRYASSSEEEGQDLTNTAKQASEEAPVDDSMPAATDEPVPETMPATEEPDAAV